MRAAKVYLLIKLRNKGTVVARVAHDAIDDDDDDERAMYEVA